MPTPAAEVHIDEALIDALVRAQFPELAGPVAIVSSGWDNVIARLGADHCVRMPRRALSAPLVDREAFWLPRLADHLPVEVPAAVAVGMPALGYPWSWLLCPWFEGHPLTDTPVHARTVAAAELGEFLVALHRAAAADAPVSPWRGIPLAVLDERVHERFQRMPPADAAPLQRIWKRTVDAPPHDGPPIWLHGDLHPLNILVTGGSPARVRAVIDWGDLCCGDPAVDLAVAWLGFDADGRREFRAALAQRHPLDDAVWDRALAWAVSLTMLFRLDTEPGTALAGIGEHALAQLLAEPRARP